MMETVVNAFTANWYFSLAMTVGVIYIIFSAIQSMMKTAIRERSRREIAAYIAEGSMTPEEGERLLNAGKRTCC